MARWEVEYGVWLAGGRMMRTRITVEAESAENAIEKARTVQRQRDAAEGRANTGYFAKAIARPLS